MRFDYDVIVVGAGPAGLTAGRFCAKSGLKTLIIEKENLPRYKPCGGCLSLKTVYKLGFDIAPLTENIIYGAKFSYCFKDQFVIRSKNPIAFLIMRDRFDKFLADKAIEDGSEILEGVKVLSVEEGNGGIFVKLSKGDFVTCEYLIGADGAGSMVARSIFQNREKGQRNGIAIESEIPFNELIHSPREEFQLVHLDFGQIPNGYGWVFPKKNYLSIGIGGMFKEEDKIPIHRYFNSFLKGLGYIQRKEDLKPMGHPLPTFYSEDQKVSKGKILLVGDAANLMDPLQGEGIYYAIYSGMLAGEAILESKEKGISASVLYQENIKNKIFNNLKHALSFSQFVYRFTKLSYKTLKRYPELGEFYLGVLEGKETYFDFIIRVKNSIKDLLKGRISDKIREALSKT